jgi:hypothetical protein
MSCGRPTPGDIIPTPRGKYVLYEDSTAAYFHVSWVRESLREER